MSFKQLLKSAVGIVHPGAYFQHDPLVHVFESLAKIATDVNCSEELIDCLKNGPDIIREKLQVGLANGEYYHETFRKDLEFICISFQSADVPNVIF